jgi:hypothetical protein
MQENMNYGEFRMTMKNNSSKLSVTLFEGGEDNMAIPAPTTSASKSINPIHIQFGTFDFELKREDEINMVHVVPCLIKIKGINLIKRVAGPIMPNMRMDLHQGREDDEHMAPRVISSCNQK